MNKDYNPTKNRVEQCRCRGEISNCLYCQGTGIIDPNQYEKADTTLLVTSVIHCPSCGCQNRLADENISKYQQVSCYACQQPLFDNTRSPFDKPPFNRKSSA
ncbi:MAG: hypothetical protein AB1489_41490 [Acidobacteriota bacterium]